MNIKRLSALFLALLITASSVACGDSSSASGSETSASGDSSAANVQTEPSEYTVPNVDYKGKKITVAAYNYTGGWQILNYHALAEEENGDIINDAIVERNRKVEDELNIDLELFTLTGDDRGSSTRLQQQILAGDDTFAFATSMSASIGPMLTTDGMLVDLQSIPNLDLTHSWWNQNANEEYTLYGKQLAAVGDICFFNMGAPIVTYFSKKLVEDYKLDNPYQLVYDGKWTLDKMIAMATEAANDLNGNSTVEDSDQFGFGAEVDSLCYMLMCQGVRLSGRDKDGNITITSNSEKTITGVEKIIGLFYNAPVARLADHTEKKYGGGMHHEYFTPKLMADEMLFYTNQLLVSLNLRQMEGDFGLLPVPKFDEKQEQYYSTGNSWFSDHLIVPSTNTDLAMTGHILEAMGYYAQQTIVPAFIDTTVMGKSIRDEDSAKMIEIIRANQVFDIAYIFNWGNVRSMFSTLANNNNTAFATEYAKIEPAILEALKQTTDILQGK